MDLYFKSYGEGFPLIILHGFLGTGDNWYSLAQQFAKNYKVYCIDQRNHGRSPHSEDFSYALLAEDLLHFFEQENINEAYVLGHSMGGKTAMHFALSHPDKVSRLIVADIAPRAYNRGHDDVFKALFAVDLAHIQSRKEAEDAMLPFLPDAGVRQFLLKNLGRNEAGAFSWKMNLDTLYKKYDEVQKAIESTVSFNKPCLFLRGTLSAYVQDKDFADIERLFPQAYVESIAQAGHWIHAEAPEAFYQAVKRFLQ